VIDESPSLSVCSGDPQRRLGEWLSGRGGRDGLLVVEFTLRQYWLAGEPPQALIALYCLCRGALEVAVTDQVLHSDGSPGVEQFATWARLTGSARVRPGDPLSLLPRVIEKPWGREIWYTGIEARGLCRFACGGGDTPIPWLQSVLPDQLAGPFGAAPVLLKILDPVATEVVGDLYFELHEEKREVYVVTHVDEQAWPGGIGYIRYGFAPEKLAEYPEEAAFRAAYLQAVLAYEAVRREIDAASGQATDKQVSRERELRAAMNAFTHLRPVQTGDVVRVPLRLPHSLQHGVRTIEFQTPVYERKILSFAQKVLTQDHWDTRDAVAQMTLVPPPNDEFERVHQDSQRRVDRIVDFPDFQVLRVALEDRGRHPVEKLATYALVMVVSGRLLVGAQTPGPEEALLLPRGWSGELVSADPGRPLVLLLATPHR
jgi:hypothetical protein